MESYLYQGSGFNFWQLSKPVRAYAYYLDQRINLLTMEYETFGLSTLLAELAEVKLSTYIEKPRLIHLSYEAGHITEETEIDVSRDQILAIDIVYQKTELCSLEHNSGATILELKKTDYRQYKKSFEQVIKYLKAGDAYQINLTTLCKLKIKNLSIDTLGTFYQKDRIAAYAHASYIPQLDFALISNSPECLCSIVNTQNHYLIKAMPIKGTIALDNSKIFATTWKKLSSSAKEQAELFMIADMLRNDLARIEHPRAEIKNKKLPLIVNRILHQYSLIECPLSEKVNLKQIITAVYPGGSITGAPKKRVMRLIDEIEKSPRGFYCGSTLFLFKDIKRSSINIRTMEVKLSRGIANLGSGGGITLQSRCLQEYREMLLKVSSFLG